MLREKVKLPPGVAASSRPCRYRRGPAASALLLLPRESAGVSGASQTRSVDNFVVKLRKKIEENASQPRHIVTIYGMGYKLVP